MGHSMTLNDENSPVISSTMQRQKMKHKQLSCMAVLASAMIKAPTKINQFLFSYSIKAVVKGKRRKAPVRYTNSFFLQY